MAKGPAYPYLRAILAASVEAAPGWVKAPGKFIEVLSSELASKNDAEAAALRKEIASIPDRDLEALVREHGAKTDDAFDTIKQEIQKLGHFLEQHVSTPNRIPNNFPRPLNTFTGREDDLKRLDSLLKESSAVLLLNGLGGIGKTMLAIEYANRYKNEWNTILWVDYAGSLHQSLVDFAPLIQHADSGETVTIDDIIAVLSGYDGRNLLVIDNFTRNDNGVDNGDTARISQFLRNFTLLITSREKLPGNVAVAMPLDELPREEAITLFEKYYSKHCDPVALDDFLVLIDDHTLTIEITTKTLADSFGRVTLDDIIEVFRSKKFNTPKGEITAEIRHSLQQTKINSYLAELFTLAKIPDDQKRILRLFALLPPVFIAEELLPVMLGIDDNAIGKYCNTVKGLVDTGWLTRTDEGIRCHPLVQSTVLRDGAPSFEEAEPIVLFLTNRMHNDFTENPLNGAVWIPYVRSLLDAMNGTSQENEKIAALFNNAALIYNALGDLDKALAFARKAMEIFEAVLPNKHPSLATSYNNVAGIYQDHGDLVNAIIFAKKAIAIDEAVLADYHPDLATSYNNIAGIYQNLGELDSALDFAKKAIAIDEAVQPDNHPYLAKSYNNVAMIYKDHGELDNALDFAKKAMEIRETALHDNHPDLANSYSNIATIYQDHGELDNALVYMLKAIAICEAVWPPNHYLFRTVYHNLASIYKVLGDTEKAREYLAKAEAVGAGDSSPRPE